MPVGTLSARGYADSGVDVAAIDIAVESRRGEADVSEIRCRELARFTSPRQSEPAIFSWRLVVHVGCIVLFPRVDGQLKNTPSHGSSIGIADFSRRNVARIGEPSEAQKREN